MKEPELINVITRRYLRNAGILLGVFFIFWLPLEDSAVGFLLAYSTAWAGWLAIYLYTRRSAAGISRRQALLFGTLFGLGIPLLAVALMVFKSGVHAHGFMDYRLQLIQQVLLFTPLWAVCGTAFGYFLVLQQEKTHKS